MSVSGIFSSIGNNQASAVSSPLQKSQFQQLGQDLASGNLTAAQSDFANLQQAFQHSTNLKSGDLIQQDVRGTNSPRRLHHHHHLRITSGSDPNPLQDLNQLGQDLSTASSPSGSVTTAQQAYASSQPPSGAGTQSDVPDFVHRPFPGPATVGLHAPMPPVFRQPVSFVA